MRSEDPVAVAVAEDRDPLPVADGGKHAINRAGHPLNRRRLGKIASGWGLNEGINILDPAADENVEQWLAEKHTPSSQPGSGALSVVELRIGPKRPST